MKTLLFLTSLLFVSCSFLKEDEAKTEAYFKAQYRDPKLIGKWALLNDETLQKEEDGDAYEYHQSGEVYNFYRQHKGRKEFFYTKNDRLYRLSPGDWKISAKVFECLYKIEGNILTLQYIDQGKISDIKSLYIKE